MTQTSTNPVEVDTFLSQNYGQQALYFNEIAAARSAGVRANEYNDKIDAGERGYSEHNRYDAAYFASIRAKIASAKSNIETLAEAAAPSEKLYRQQKWTRAYLVTNSNGHVHKDRSCSTCFASTDYYWVTDLSGHDEAEIVDLAGEKACTVCYPTAPVEALNKPTSIFTPEQRDQEKARQERQEKRQAAASAEVKLSQKVDGKLSFKSERGATNYIASQLGSMVHYGPSHPSFALWCREVNVITEALADRGVEYDLKAGLEKARKKIRSEYKAFKKDPRYKQLLADGLIDEASLVEGYDPAKY